MSRTEWIEFTRGLYELYDQYIDECLHEKKRDIACTMGCSYCCNHWVEDIYAFEMKTIISYIKEQYPDKIKRIEIESTGAEMEMEQILENEEITDESYMLNRFYTLQIPCPLLDSEGKCIVYPVRPLTCRSFFSRDVNRFCLPPVCDDELDGTFMVLLNEQVETVLDELHFKACLDESIPTSLRSALAYCINK